MPNAWTDDPARVRPMLATLADPPLDDPRLAYEPKYDGIRALVLIEPPRPGRTGADAGVRLWSRQGNDKTAQFPDAAGALARFGRRLDRPLLVDGEVVALAPDGRPVSFQNLQGRIHLTGAREIERAAAQHPVAFIAFDLLRDGAEDLRPLPFRDRRARLEQIFARASPRAAAADGVRISAIAYGDGRALEDRARIEGWEGLIAKDVRSTYESGRRSPAWRKKKLSTQQEFVVGGWTEPRSTRSGFGALLLGVYRGGELHYVGHTGSGFTQAELDRVHRHLRALEIDRSPFAERPKTNEPAHWVRPELVAQVRFTEWTADARLRHPIYLGLREDVRPSEVRREPERGRSGGQSLKPGKHGSRPARDAAAPKPAASDLAAVARVVDQLQALEDARRDGVLELPNGDRVKVTNLRKVFWPESGITKGDLLRYYTTISPYILPAVADRPLVMKRFPNGIHGQAFYQQRAREERPPAGVRIETLPPDIDPIDEPDAQRLIGGSLTTLLYMTQLAAISQDPWFSRVQSPLDADYMALDLDPMDDVPFSQVLDVARWVRDELVRIGAPGVPKTSGASGLHIYVPMPPDTSYESGQLFCQIIATVVAANHPKQATVERTVRKRGKTVYVDYLQNILGKTLATAYSARASEFAGVSTPLTWEEVDAGVDPRDFTIRTMPDRVREAGDVWARLRLGPPADLHAVLR